ncbi:DUF2911 domain-containing protein [Mesonia aquimarina]|uniref:DUF2911 domain-containing protein n=1 Tax=Mesonia aquimarina TaxID=1504967 RepID=UPI000EF5C3DB|nr:DUF2911 domain-containing protein [Mesonia aquimarina]
MHKKIKWTVLSLVILILGGTIGFYSWKGETKSYSPEDTVNFKQAGLKIEVFYNRPYRKGRELFGNLVPYGEVWRTGANEATTISFNKDIMVDGSLLKSGKYTLWTIPNKDSWKVIFNDKMYAWGIELTTEKAAREASFDALTLETPVTENKELVEQFTISFKEQQGLINMKLAWGKTLISIPIKEVS